MGAYITYVHIQYMCITNLLGSIFFAYEMGVGEKSKCLRLSVRGKTEDCQGILIHVLGMNPAHVNATSITSQHLLLFKH